MTVRKGKGSITAKISTSKKGRALCSIRFFSQNTGPCQIVGFLTGEDDQVSPRTPILTKLDFDET